MTKVSATGVETRKVGANANDVAAYIALRVKNRVARDLIIALIQRDLATFERINSELFGTDDSADDALVATLNKEILGLGLQFKVRFICPNTAKQLMKRHRENCSPWLEVHAFPEHYEHVALRPEHNTETCNCKGVTARNNSVEVPADARTISAETALEQISNVIIGHVGSLEL